MDADRTWEDADPRRRPILLDRFVMAQSGTTRRPLAHTIAGVEFVEVLRAVRGGVKQNETVPIVEPVSTIRCLSESSWRTFTRKAVLLPETWQLGDPIPPQRFRVEHVAAHAATQAQMLETQQERRQQIEEARQSRKTLEAHLQRDWDNGEFLLVSAQDDVLDQRHLNHYNAHPRAKNWLARSWCERKAPGNVGREFLARVPGNWACCRMDHLRVGDYVEAGADDISYNGHRTPNRLYFRILVQAGDVLILRRRNEPPPLRLDEPAVESEIEELRKWLATREELAVRFQAVLE